MKCGAPMRGRKDSVCAPSCRGTRVLCLNENLPPWLAGTGSQNELVASQSASHAVGIPADPRQRAKGGFALGAQRPVANSDLGQARQRLLDAGPGLGGATYPPNREFSCKLS